MSSYQQPTNQQAEPCHLKFYREYNFLIKFLIFVVYYVVGTAIISHLEGWSILHIVYYLTVTITTVGYGQFHPTMVETKMFMSFYLIIGVTLIVYITNEQNVSPKVMRDSRVALSVIAVVFCLVVGSCFYAGNEGWAFEDAFYWTVCTMTTVGYGDMTIVYDSTRVFGIFFLFTCVVVFGTTFNNITSAWIEAKEEAESIRKLQSLSSEKFTRAWVERVMGDRADSHEEGVRMDGESSASGKQHGKGCTKERFILMVLLEMNVISMKDDVKPLVKKFEALDLERTGVLGREDVESFVFEIQELMQKQQQRDDEKQFEINPLHTVSSM